MDDNFLLFRLYTFSVLIFLFPLVYFVSLQLFKIFQLDILLFFISNCSLNKSQDDDELLFIFKRYIKRKQWLLCIAMLEFYHCLFDLDSFVTYGYLAFCYEKLLYIDLAEYCYLQYLKFQPSDLVNLKKLANLYEFKGESSKASSIYRRILTLDQNYQVPVN